MQSVATVSNDRNSENAEKCIEEYQKEIETLKKAVLEKDEYIKTCGRIYRIFINILV